MSYKSILVNLDIDEPSSAVVKLAAELAKRFDARLIGLSAADAPLPVLTADGMVFDGEALQIQRDDIEKRIEQLRVQFEKLVSGSVKSEWRGAVCDPTRFLVDSARSADLIITGVTKGSVFRAVDLGALMLDAGRPVLVVASNVEHVLAATVLVAWKDTREARRAVADALPFLTRAAEVVVAIVDNEPDVSIREGVADVATFLGHHGVKARAEVIGGDNDGSSLISFARSIHADLIVSGAYGHSRLREWVFGGVTRTLLDESGINRFMSY